jgi:glycosyltransferase involved in cell wall biosynthesis
MLSIVMPAHNEQGYLEPAVKTVVGALRAREAPFEVLIVENGSTDATAVEAEALAQTYEELRVLRLPNADYGRALRTGFLGAGGEVVVNFDVDFVDMAFLEEAVSIMDDGITAIVVGSKRVAGADDQRGLGRKLVTAGFSLTMRYWFGLEASDTHGLKALRRHVLAPLVERCRSGRDIFDTELILRAERAGLVVREIPVTVVERRPPRTPIARRIPGSIIGLIRLHRSIS